MPLSLHAAFVPNALQTLGACANLLTKAEAWCADEGHDRVAVISARLHETMLPFSYQVKSVAAHTAGAIAGLRAGVFSPEMTPPPGDFAGLRRALDSAQAELQALGEDEMEAFVDAPMRFEFRDTRMPFSAQDFLLSFSQPNYYFHAATAYDILRMLGVGLGKRDFLGRMRLATA